MADTGSDAARADDPFVEYYTRESISPRTIERFQGTMNAVLRVRAASNLKLEGLDVADVGCNTGTQALMWAERNHRVRGLDINEGLLTVARIRCQEAKRDATFALGNATDLPWESASADVCLLPELLEHVADWQSCVNEACRVLRPGGTLFLSTTNALCPIQNEFDLPLYSWYPKFLKKHYEHVSVTTRPELVNHAKFPAVHWFTPYGLGRYVRALGFDTFDRFDFMDVSHKSPPQQLVLKTLRALPPLRWLAHVATPYTAIIANKRG
jgi:2-polyprenyl-6-hydroxyphenyl methylase/3-demethylubiquinone-9 3-methyltransferase